jgi:hypothetical protein
VIGTTLLRAAAMLGPSHGPSLTPPVPTKRATPWLAIAMVVLAAAFGVTAAIILLMRTPQQPVVIQMPSAAPATAAPPSDTSDVPPPDTATAPSTSTAPGKPAVAMHGPKPSSPSGGGGAAPAPTNSAIAALLGGNNGPAPGGPSSGGGGGGGGSSLTSDQVERTVHNYQAGVRRSCYDRLATDKTGTVQVTVTATVGPSGSVQSASADGNEPMISKCIEGAVRGWQFPATGSTTTVRIPFKFVRQ